MLPDEIEAAPVSVLLLMAHPDDLEFMVGGSVARWREAGTKVHLVLVTRGEGGNENHPDWTSERVVAEREQEQARSTQLLGLAGVTWLDERDGETVASIALRRRMVEEIRRVRPAVVVLLDPTRVYHGNYINHPDHRAVGEAALAAVYPLAGNPMYAPELGAPHRLQEVWVTLATQPNVFVDITAHIERKIEAIACHASQIKDRAVLGARIRAWNEYRLADGAVSYREYFQRIVF